MATAKGKDSKNGKAARATNTARVTKTSIEKTAKVKTKERDDTEIKDLMNRLNRVEGQIRGIKKMLEEGAYCTDILIQVAAANSALNSFNKVLMTNHINTCVVNDIKKGKKDTVDELVKTLGKLMK